MPSCTRSTIGVPSPGRSRPDGRGIGAAPPHKTEMAAKRTIHPPKLRLDLPWSQLAKAQQNQLYTAALHAYTQGESPNPGTSGQYHRAKVAEEAKG